MKDVMKKIILHIIAATALLFAFSGALFSQSTIRGIVKSGPGGTPVQSAAITIGVDLVGITDTNGNYSFGVASGTNTLEAAYNGDKISKIITFDDGDNWMNFWFDPPALPSDFDGNYYNTVTIGTQTWMVENLKVTHFTDGSNIPVVTGNTAWSALITPGYCWYDNDFSANKDIYGALYNFYAANTGDLCPVGWHVPSDSEWSVLTDYLGGESVAGDKLRETGSIHWSSANTGATNESGFTGLPGGNRPGDGTFNDIGASGAWWSPASGVGWYRYLGAGISYVGRVTIPPNTGISVRCLMDLTIPAIVTNTGNNGPGSLRNAILFANSTIGIKDTITFNIPGTGPFTIKPLTQLPAITDPVIIDGYSQPGASVATASDPATIMIEILGEMSGAPDSGLVVRAGNCNISGLSIRNFQRNLILYRGWK